MLATKKTHVDKVKLQYCDNEQLIQALLDMSQLDYSMYKFDMGIDYAKRMTDGDEMGYNMLISTRFFWQWWKNEWAKRDAEFLDMYSATANRSALLDQYQFMHSAYRLNDDSLMSKKAVSMVGFAIDEYMKAYAMEGAK